MARIQSPEKEGIQPGIIPHPLHMGASLPTTQMLSAFQKLQSPECQKEDPSKYVEPSPACGFTGHLDLVISLCCPISSCPSSFLRPALQLSLHTPSSSFSSGLSPDIVLWAVLSPVLSLGTVFEGIRLFLLSSLIFVVEPSSCPSTSFSGSLDLFLGSPFSHLTLLSIPPCSFVDSHYYSNYCNLELNL